MRQSKLSRAHESRLLTASSSVLNGGSGILAAVVILSCIVAGQTADSQQPQAARRDEQSLTLLRKELETLGGSQLWTKTRGLRAHGQLLDPTGATTVVWEDHWDGHFKMSRHSKLHDVEQAYLQNPDKQRSESRKEQESKPLPRHHDFDPLSALATHAPGAAIALVLGETKYSANIVFQHSQDTRDLDCVKLSNTRAEGGSPANVVLCATHEGIPRRAFIQLENVKLPEQHLWEIVEFQDYVQVQGQSFPSLVSIKTPTGHVRQYRFSAFDLNPSIDKVVFREVEK